MKRNFILNSIKIYKQEFLKDNKMDEDLMLLVTNSKFSFKTFKNLYKISSKTILADGCSNRLYSFSKKENKFLIPFAILGDLDSIKKKSYDFYEKKVKIIIN
jgi:thiamine pyrophosphokinase